MMRRLAPFAGVFAVAGLLAQADIDKTGRQTGTVTTGKHLSVRANATGLTGKPGQPIALILDVTPGPKIHLYAPGQPGYIPVSFTLKASDEFTSTPPVFPASRPFFFEPTTERLQVYDEPFRISQVVTLAVTPALQRRAAAKETLTIAGALDYQACDDKVCFRPDSVPLKWEIALGASR